MKMMNHGRRTMRITDYTRKSIALVIGSVLLLTGLSFGTSPDQKEYRLTEGISLYSFSLVRGVSTGLERDYLSIDSVQSHKWIGPLEVVYLNKIDADVKLAGEESDAIENETKTRKLAGVLRLGSASITPEGYGSSFTYGLGLYMHLSEKIGLEITLDRYSVPVDKDFEGMGTGKLQVTPLLLSGQWHFTLGRFVPYAAAGAGFYFINFEPDLKAQPRASQELVYADRFALHFGGGVNVRVTSALDFFADLRYSLIKTWIQERDEHHVHPEEQNIFNLNTLVLALGIRYFF